MRIAFQQSRGRSKGTVMMLILRFPYPLLNKQPKVKKYALCILNVAVVVGIYPLVKYEICGTWPAAAPPSCVASIAKEMLVA